jgi:hypothetical protein
MEAPSPEPQPEGSAIPTIKISSHDRSASSVSAIKDSGAAKEEDSPDVEEGDIASPMPNGGGAGAGGAAGMRALVEKPVQAAADDKQDLGDLGSQPAEPFSFSNKRLCERWLDNLFMVLYEVCSLLSLTFALPPFNSFCYRGTAKLTNS